MTFGVCFLSTRKKLVPCPMIPWKNLWQLTTWPNYVNLQRKRLEVNVTSKDSGSKRTHCITYSHHFLGWWITDSPMLYHHTPILIFGFNIGQMREYWKGTNYYLAILRSWPFWDGEFTWPLQRLSATSNLRMKRSRLESRGWYFCWTSWQSEVSGITVFQEYKIMGVHQM